MPGPLRDSYGQPMGQPTMHPALQGGLAGVQPQMQQRQTSPYAQQAQPGGGPGLAGAGGHVQTQGRFAPMGGAPLPPNPNPAPAPNPVFSPPNAGNASNPSGAGGGSSDVYQPGYVPPGSGVGGGAPGTNFISGDQNGVGGLAQVSQGTGANPNEQGQSGGTSMNPGYAPSYGANAGADAAAAGWLNMGRNSALAAPTIDQTQIGADRALGLQGLQGQQQALALQQQTAMGGGAAHQALQGQFNQQLGSNINSQLALANSARGGGAALAAAQSQAQGNAAQQTGAAGQAAGIAQAQLSAQAQQGLSGAESQYAQNVQGLQSLDTGAATAQATLQAQQNAQNQQTALGYSNFANAAELGQLDASGNVYANNAGLAGTAQTIQANQTNSVIGAGATGVAAGVGLLAAL